MMNRRSPANRRAGFTLLEVIIAIGILALIATMTFETISGALRARDMLEANDALNQSARAALGKLRRDLSLAYLTPQTQAVNTFRTVFVAKDDSPDRLWFASLSHQRLYRDAHECDETEITIWTEDDPTTDGALVLLRREAPRIDQDPEQGGTILPLAYKVKSFEVRFQDPTNNEWRDTWDSTGGETPNRLPRTARITLTLLGPGDEPDELTSYPFMTDVILEYASPLKRGLFAGGT